MRKKYYARRRRRRARKRFYVITGLLVVVLAVGIYLIVKGTSSEPGSSLPPSETVNMTAPSALPTQIEEPTETPDPSPEAELLVQATENTDPAGFGFKTDIMDDGTETDTYQRTEAIMFATGSEYSVLDGIMGFRGNNYRDAASFGFADITEQTLSLVRTKHTGSDGIGWTGQPLIVKWPVETRELMTTLYDEFRHKDDFIEVIYASLSGDIYFMELGTGEKTRDPIDVGGAVSGTPALDPRGYPIIYVGQTASGSSSSGMYVRAFSLIDGSRIMKFGAENKDPFAYRDWQGYGASPLIDAGTDTLIYPGENGVLYTCKLNTSYDASTGEVTMDANPTKVKYRYTSTRNEDATDLGGRWGMENSPVAWRNYLFFTDNVGMLQCVDLNTMSLVYANDLTDDSDATMVLQEDTAGVWLYTGCKYDPLIRDLGNTGPVYARKIDALSGEVIWEVPFTVVSDSSGNGGIWATSVVGKADTSMEGLVIFGITRVSTGSAVTSKLVALNQEDGTQVWEYDMQTTGMSPSSPVPVYTRDGKGYIVQCDADGDVALIDGATGQEAAKLNVNGTEDAGDDNRFEGAPAIYGNTIVVGSRGERIFFIEIN